MKSPIHQDTRIAAFAEGQMRTWERLQETAAHAAGRREHDQLLAQAVKLVTISREAGADGRAPWPDWWASASAGRFTTGTCWIRLPNATRNRD